MTRRPNLVRSELLIKAKLDFACPRCSAGPGARCRVMFGDDPRGTRDALHPERVQAAWRALLEGGDR
jgi:hypothetical protein